MAHFQGSSPVTSSTLAPGIWEGDYGYGGFARLLNPIFKRKFRMSLEVRPGEGMRQSIEGVILDLPAWIGPNLGEAVFRGEFDERTREIVFVKRYCQGRGHEIVYQGALRQGALRGSWTIHTGLGREEGRWHARWRPSSGQRVDLSARQPGRG